MRDFASASGHLFILVGPSGTGKNTLMDGVRAVMTDIIQLPTMTTRAPRPNEIEGIHHYFVSVEQFRALVANNALLEHQEVHPGKWYGVPRQQTWDSLSAGKIMIADVDIAGALDVQSAFPHNVTTIFIKPPSLDILRERLITRHKQSGKPDDDQELIDRLAKASYELGRANECNYVIVNDTREQATHELMTVIQQVLATQRSI